jgi:hypothetical protein
MGLYKYQGWYRIRFEVPWTPAHIRKEETMTEALKKDYQKTCAERIDEQWRLRREDLKDPEFEGLGFDYVEPHTFTDQLEGYWRWQFSWGGPSDELRAFVNENNEIHRLEYWFMDWMDGAKLELQPGNSWPAEWQRMQEMIGMAT